ncbi:MAG: flavodoxin domain-containing protein [Ruegeria sp.]
MSVLIAFGTVEGQSGKIACFIRDIATEAGIHTTLLDTCEIQGEVSFEGVDKVILAAPVHERRHPKRFEEFVAAQRDSLAKRKSLVLSVSLKAAFLKSQEEAEDYLAEMLLRTHFEPDRTALVAGAVHPECYDYFETEIVRHVVLQEQRVDPRNGIQEFTDWDALRATVTAFLNE